MRNALITHCTLATMQSGRDHYGLIEGAALAIEDGMIAWVGNPSSVPEGLTNLPTQNLEGRLVTPALIDCHTHLVFGGNRAQEFEQRLGGASYEDIAAAGGGIASTVRATRGASDAELLAQALKRLDNLLAEGVAVVEIKSGYGLTVADELRMLRVARQLGHHRPVHVVTSWLAAHALPSEYAGKQNAYIDDVVIPGMAQAKQENLIDAVDGYCESLAFTPQQMDRVFCAAKNLNLPVKLHAEQLSDQKGALLLAQHQGLSADHLEYLAPADVKPFAASGAVAVLLPGAYYTLKATQLPPVEALRSAEVDLAVATDCNPGTSPCSSLLLAMNMACTLFALTPEEALAGVTRCAAKALGLESEYGVIAPGLRAELAVWDVDHPAELAYWMGQSPLAQRITQEFTQ
ncbi:MAG: imidazolonepropionase [Lysobacterales bacterium]